MRSLNIVTDGTLDGSFTVGLLARIPFAVGGARDDLAFATFQPQLGTLELGFLP
jgi:hypothetical protein